MNSISGSGKDGRVTKEDILNMSKVERKVESQNKNQFKLQKQEPPNPVAQIQQPTTNNHQLKTVPVSVNGGDEIIEMDRMRKLISKYMVESFQTSAHVQSFIEVDVTNIVKWRDKVKMLLRNEKAKN